MAAQTPVRRPGNAQRESSRLRFAGALAAARNAVQIQIEVLPSKPTERCPYAVHSAFHDDLNAATQYTLSSRYLTVFSKMARLTFERVGYVTPANK
jgi:hypothetical protein